MTPLRPGFCLSFFIALTVCSLLPAARSSAEGGKEWQFSEITDPKSARLIYGVPETDDIQVSGACDAGASAGTKSSSVTFGADIGDLENGKDTELRVSGGGFDHALKGKILRATGEEGLSGVEVEIENDNPLWQAMAEKDQLDYLVPGYRAGSLDLTRGRDKIQQFVKTCEAYAGSAAPPAASADSGSADDAEKEAFDSAKELGMVEGWEAFIANYPSGFHADLARAYIKKLGSNAPTDNTSMPNVSASKEVPDPPCRNRKNIRSMVSEEKTKLTFINRSGATRSIIWIDFNSKDKSFGRLKNGEQIELDTFVTHPWMVTNSGGACLQIVEPDTGARVVVLEGSGEQPAEKKPLAKKVTGCEEGFKLVKGKCKRIAEKEVPQGCPAGTKPVPETDDCAPITSGKSKSGCPKGQIRVEGNCILKQDAASYCWPGYRLQGSKCVQGYAAPKPQNVLPSWQLKAIGHGCAPGQDWNAQEGCHEND
jgi:hypothetical protein